ncbi:hypothetical protein R1T16_09390 [Flavobacterium sp. DG1-102-2]|uniref:hypothetical protein n=1 Tax=Flavobacterium sp. DG1-102-2 TaxID=3081663 RepID=UPI002948D5B4|nr:hypothetical protein [Flavobacterium sp. DG1-102-2]MDV6168636.1 hypothetical protein [Flavobacterium sp. DG1-102-2]
MEFRAIRTCKNCGSEDEYALSKIDAAFSLKYDLIQSKKCTKCNSDKWSEIKYPSPYLDKELLDIWGADLDLNFMDQDEDIILAEEENLPLFLEAIDNKRYPQSKLNILLSALCILAYDNIIAPEEYTAAENIHRKAKADRVINELTKRKHLLTNLSWEIMDYIKEVIFPRLDIKIPVK